MSKRSFLVKAAAATTIFSFRSPVFGQSRPGPALVPPLENNELYRVFWNYHATTSASPQERRRQFDALVRLSAVTMDPGWKTRTTSSKRNALQSATISTPGANDKAFQDLKRTLYVSAGATLAVYFITRNLVAATTILTGAAVKIPANLQNIDKLISAATAAYSGYTIFRDDLGPIRLTQPASSMKQYQQTSTRRLT